MFKWIPLFGGEVLMRTLFAALLLAGLLGWFLYGKFSGGSWRRATTDYLRALVVGLAAARAVEYIVFLPSYLGQGHLVRSWTYLGGCFWPGLAVGLATLWFFTRRRGDAPWPSVAAGAVTLTFAMAPVWIGALLDGSAWGAAGDVPWALGPGQYGVLVPLFAFGPAAAFMPGISAAYTIHPVQVYFALGCLLIGLGGVFLKKRLAPRPFSAVLVAALALLWFGLGFLRADDPVLFLGLCAPQIMALGGLVWSTAILLTEKKIRVNRPPTAG
ncbi:MAG TPA: prolipoprotein diacylglyceryl transferase family protein [bacterium]|nr:prolipoprotein diacylglyceryl transferase family protein [bacterium]